MDGVLLKLTMTQDKKNRHQVLKSKFASLIQTYRFGQQFQPNIYGENKEYWIGPNCIDIFSYIILYGNMIFKL